MKRFRKVPPLLALPALVVALAALGIGSAGEQQDDIEVEDNKEKDWNRWAARDGLDCGPERPGNRLLSVGEDPHAGMKRFRKVPPLLALALTALVVVLAALGIGYGLWAKTLTVNAQTVATDPANASLSAEGATIAGITPANNDTLGIASCSESLNAAGDILSVTFDNAFPMLCCNAEFNVTNTGTIPINVGGPVITGDGLPALTNSLSADCYADQVQLNTGASAFCTLQICVNEEAAQNATYTVDASITVTANEAVAAAPTPFSQVSPAEVVKEPSALPKNGDSGWQPFSASPPSIAILLSLVGVALVVSGFAIGRKRREARR